MYLDVHAHFSDEGYDVAAERRKIAEAGVRRVILASDTVAHSASHCETARICPEIYFAAGVHPSETAGFDEGALRAVETLAGEEKCVAIGEIGLDYHYPDTDKAAQQRAFSLQLELAHRLRLPVQIHSRDCAEDMLAMLTERKELLTDGFLMHCYSHSEEMMDSFAVLGAYFSFGGVITFRNAKKAVACAAHCPPDRLLTETDSPYLSPFRGEKNTPANIPVILSRLAQIRGEEEETLKERIWNNAFALFGRLR